MKQKPGLDKQLWLVIFIAFLIEVLLLILFIKVL